MVNVRIPPGANCLLATKLQTDSTGAPLESVIHIGYEFLTITTIHPKDSLLWKVFSHRGFLFLNIYCTEQYPLAFSYSCHQVWTSISKFVRWGRGIQAGKFGVV